MKDLNEIKHQIMRQTNEAVEMALSRVDPENVIEMLSASVDELRDYRLLNKSELSLEEYFDMGIAVEELCKAVKLAYSSLLIMRIRAKAVKTAVEPIED